MNKPLSFPVKAAMNKSLPPLALLCLPLLACGSDPKVDTPEITQAESSFNDALRTFCKEALQCYQVDDADENGVKYCEVPSHITKGQTELIPFEERHATGDSKCDKKVIAEHTQDYLDALDCAKQVLGELTPKLNSCPDIIPDAEDFLQCFYPLDQYQPSGCD